MKQYLIPILFLSGTLFFSYLFVVGPPRGEPKKEPAFSVKKQGTIPYNRLRNLQQQTQVSMDLRRQQAVLNKVGRKPNLDPAHSKRHPIHETGLDRDLGPAADDLANEGSREALTLDQRMDEFLARRQQYQEMEQVKREQYVDAFIAEARRMGFRVRVNDAMEIVDVQKIESQ